MRDLGGIPVRGGLRVRRGLVFRSGELTRLSDGDIARLVALGVGLVFDLRSPHERAQRPSRRWPKEPERWHAETGDSGADLPRLLAQMVAGPGGMRGSMIDVYRALPYEQADVFAAIFLAIAKRRMPLLLHCAAGKDRTGAFVALLLQMLGAHAQAVEQDYLASNIHFEKAQRRFLARIDRPEISASTWDPLLRVDPDYLAAMNDAIASRSGGLDAYLARIGIGPTEQAAIRSNMLEKHDER